MAKRNLIIIAIAVVAIAAVSHYSSNRSAENSDENIGQPLVGTSLFETTDEIVINKSKDRVELKKSGDQWLVTNKDGFPADMEKLLKLVEKFTSYEISAMVTKDPERLGAFEALYDGEENATAETVGYQFTLKQQGRVLNKVVVGKTRTSKQERSPGSGGTYVRKGDQKVVYLIKDDLFVETDPKSWIQTALFKLEKETIQSIDLKSEAETLSFSREEAKKPFVLTDLKDAETLESNPISGLLNDLSDFSFDDINLITEKEKELTPASQVTVKTFDDKAIHFNILFTVKNSDKEGDVEKDYFIKILPETETFDASVAELGKKWVFSVAEWKMKKWIKEREEYLKKD